VQNRKYQQSEDPAATAWQLQEAKACFSEVVRRAERRPQRVTVRGKDAVVVLSAHDYDRLLPKSGSTLSGLMAASPLSEIEFGEQGDAMPVREVEL